jgi:hypothetical protein
MRQTSIRQVFSNLGTTGWSSAFHLSSSFPMTGSAGSDAALLTIAKALRQICLFQETGRNEEASQLESVLLDPLIRSFRASHGADSLPEAQLGSLRASERKRVSDAAALGELLAPLLLEQLRRPPESLRSPPPASSRPPTSPRPGSPANIPGIADLLDGMLAQDGDRPAPRPRHLP